MSNKSRKYCMAYPCNNIATDGAYCAEHRPPRAPKRADAFYTSVMWKRFRKQFISKYPLCAQCQREGYTTPATIIDHIVEIKDGGLLLDESNIQSLCHKCHNAKTAKEKARRKNHQ